MARHPYKEQSQESAPNVRQSQPNDAADLLKQKRDKASRLNPTEAQALRARQEAKQKATTRIYQEKRFNIVRKKQRERESARERLIQSNDPLEAIKLPEQIQQRAMSEKVSMFDLKGWEWLGLTIKNHAERYRILGEAYLQKQGDGFVVRADLDKIYKTKFGLGAADVIPPSVTAAAITDRNGKTRIGVRKIENGRVGYYDEKGYIPIFGGYAIVPQKRIDESGNEYQRSLETEKENYLRQKRSMNAFIRGSTRTPREVRRYVGPIKRQISTLQSLRTAESSTETERAKKDWQVVQQLLEQFGIRLDPKSEIDGGAMMMSLHGEATKMLQEATPLILAMQHGTEFYGYRFRGTYELDITDLPRLQKLAASSSEELQAILGEKSSSRLNPYDVLARLERPKNAEKGMDINEAITFAHRYHMRELLGDGGHKSLQDLYENSQKVSPLDRVRYRFDALAQYRDFPRAGGEKMCAYTVSTFLGLGERETGFRGKIGAVMDLVPRLMASNRAKTGSEGIIFGFENLQAGDVLVWDGTRKHGWNRFGHVGIVRDIVSFRGEKYAVIQDDGTDLEMIFIPVDRKASSTLDTLRAVIKDPKERAKFPEIDRACAWRSTHPSTILVRENAGWYGDGSKGSGKIQFAVRTSALAAAPEFAQR